LRSKNRIEPLQIQGYAMKKITLLALGMYGATLGANKSRLHLPPSPQLNKPRAPQLTQEELQEALEREKRNEAFKIKTAEDEARVHKETLAAIFARCTFDPVFAAERRRKGSFPFEPWNYHQPHPLLSSAHQAQPGAK
jgi:hypothetical protein